MNNNDTVIDIFSLFYNLKNIIEKDKMINDQVIDGYLLSLVFNRTKEHVKYQYKKVWNDLENGFYNYRELKLYLLYQYFIGKKPFIAKIERDKVKEISQKFSKEQWETDKQVIKQICKRINKKNIKEFLEIKKEDETYVVHELIEKNLIGPLVFINYYDKLENLQENDKLKKIIKIIKQELNKNKEEICIH